MTIAYQNIHLDGNYSLGIVNNNIPNLNVEETKIQAIQENKNKGFFEVIIRKSNLSKVERYAIKPFANCNREDLNGHKDEIIELKKSFIYKYFNFMILSSALWNKIVLNFHKM